MFSNRNILLLILLGVATLLVGYALFFYPGRKAKGSEVRRDVMEMEALLKATEIQFTKSEAAVEELLTGGVPVYLHSEKTWDEWRTQLIKNIDDWVRDTNVALLKLEPEESEERPPLIGHPFYLEFEGSFQEICQFMQGVEQGLKMIPEHWSLEEASQDGEEENLKANCRLVAYEWVGQVFTPPTAGGEEIQLLQVASGRDPFMRWVEPTEPIRTRPAPKRLKLTGIVRLKGQPRAIINGQPYKIGDTLGGRRVLSISEDEVSIEGEPKPLRIERDLQFIPPS